MSSTGSPIETLGRLGFSPYEAQAYVALLGQPALNGSEVGKRAAVPPSKIYETLSRLEAKGAVLVNRSEPIRYKAVPVEEVLAGMKQRFDTDLSAAAERLADVPDATTPGLVWSLTKRDAILQAFLRTIRLATTQIFAGLWDEELDSLAAPLEEASRRGVAVHVAVYGHTPLTGPHSYDLSECGGSARLRLSGRRLAVLVADDRETVVSEFGSVSLDEAILTTNRIASLLAVEYVKADVSGRLLINGMTANQYQQVLATPEMKAMLTQVP